MSDATSKHERWVRCPACGKQAVYGAQNPARPFCSTRCRSVDLGAWASESYRAIAVDRPDDEGETPPTPTAH